MTRPQQVLDLDLDFFLDAIAVVPFDDGEGPRRSSSRFHPWPADDVRSFLETACGLGVRKRKRPRGRTVETHDAAFYWWRDLIEQGELRSPFDVVHVDAHADLGLGDPHFRYLMCELLHRPVAERAYPDADRVLEGNYLAFAAACRWLNSITYVLHRARRNDDRPVEYFRDDDTDSGCLELRRCDPALFPADVAAGRLGRSVLSKEKAIAFHTVKAADFKATRPFDFVTLSRSPSYTPDTADSLVGVIEEYFDTR